MGHSSTQEGDYSILVSHCLSSPYCHTVIFLGNHGRVSFFNCWRRYCLPLRLRTQTGSKGHCILIIVQWMVSLHLSRAWARVSRAIPVHAAWDIHKRLHARSDPATQWQFEAYDKSFWCTFCLRRLVPTSAFCEQSVQHVTFKEARLEKLYLSMIYQKWNIIEINVPSMCTNVPTTVFKPLIS